MRRAKKETTPRFHDRFLSNVYESFVRRRKAISNQGSLDLQPHSDDDREWLSVIFVSGRSPTLILEFAERNRASLFIRSREAKRRGLVLLRIEDVFLVDNARDIVRCFEWTLSQAWSLRGETDDRIGLIEDQWRQLTLRVP